MQALRYFVWVNDKNGIRKSSVSEFSVFSVMKKGLSTGEMPDFYQESCRRRKRDTWRFRKLQRKNGDAVFPI